VRDPVFGFDVVTEYPGVPGEILLPRESWDDRAAYDATAQKLAGLLTKNRLPGAESALHPRDSAAGSCPGADRSSESASTTALDKMGSLTVLCIETDQ
jgi:hypothetical protein